MSLVDKEEEKRREEKRREEKRREEKRREEKRGKEKKRKEKKRKEKKSCKPFKDNFVSYSSSRARAVTPIVESSTFSAPPGNSIRNENLLNHRFNRLTFLNFL